MICLLKFVFFCCCIYFIFLLRAKNKTVVMVVNFIFIKYPPTPTCARQQTLWNNLKPDDWLIKQKFCDFYCLYAPCQSQKKFKKKYWEMLLLFYYWCLKHQFKLNSFLIFHLQFHQLIEWMKKEKKRKEKSKLRWRFIARQGKHWRDEWCYMQTVFFFIANRSIKRKFKHIYRYEL